MADGAAGDEGDNAAVPLDGVSLAALRAFCDECSARSFAGPAGDALRFDQLTTAQVVEQVIKRDTLERSCTYAELLLARHDASAAPASRAPVGRANAFVSHAWSYRFVELVDALLTHFEGTDGAGDAYLWLDIFVGSQHKAPNLPSRWWTETFRGAVCAVGRTVLVLQPWNAPEPLTRSWCLVRACEWALNAKRQSWADTRATRNCSGRSFARCRAACRWRWRCHPARRWHFSTRWSTASTTSQQLWRGLTHATRARTRSRTAP